MNAINNVPQWTLEPDEVTTEELMVIYMGAFEDNNDNWDELPPIVTTRCSDCHMMLEDFVEHHCAQGGNAS